MTECIDRYAVSCGKMVSRSVQPVGGVLLMPAHRNSLAEVFEQDLVARTSGGQLVCLAPFDQFVNTANQAVNVGATMCRIVLDCSAALAFLH